MPIAMKQSEDESGWTTVAVPKKQQKKKAVSEGIVATSTASNEPVVNGKHTAPVATHAVNGKPKGYQALEVEYEQRSNADPTDVSNWDA